MLTDDQARDLLRQAADTIEVGPTRPVEPVRRRRPVLVALAAAAAVAVAAGTTVVLTRGDTGADPATAPSVPPAPEQSEEGGPEPQGDARVPVVFGYEESVAVQVLVEEGFEPEVVLAPDSCNAGGRTLRTEPAAGTPAERGATVRVVVTPEPNEDCVGPTGPEEENRWWRLLDFARGVGSPPRFAEQVTSVVDGREDTVTDPDEPAAWPAGSALRAVADFPLLAERRGPDETSRLFGTGLDGGPGKVGCAGASAGGDPGIPGDLAGQESLAAWMHHQETGELGPCVVVNIFERDGAIEAVVVRHLTWQEPER
jgi:hypothetical protein